jgi:CII-binding regulator of phage lambda lysogenization HflD
LGHSDLVESNIKSTYRYFIKKGDLTIYQTHILDFLKRILTDGNDRNLKKGLILLKDEMEQLEKNRFEKRAFIYFDIISWLESKIQKRSVQEIIKEKSVKRINKVENELPL